MKAVRFSVCSRRVGVVMRGLCVFVCIEGVSLKVFVVCECCVPVLSWVCAVATCVVNWASWSLKTFKGLLKVS